MSTSFGRVKISIGILSPCRDDSTLRIDPASAETDEGWCCWETGGGKNEVVFDSVPHSDLDALVCIELVMRFRKLELEVD